VRRRPHKENTHATAVRHPRPGPHQRPGRALLHLPLALLGAEVVKVEIPEQGDLARHLGPDGRSTTPGSAAPSWPRTPASSRSS
jgi:hypothetical protein